MSQKYKKIIIRLNVSDLEGATSGIMVLHDVTVDNSRQGQDFVLLSTKSFDQTVTFSTAEFAKRFGELAGGQVNGTVVSVTVKSDEMMYGDIPTKAIVEYVK
jgi:hypothetical protein